MRLNKVLLKQYLKKNILSCYGWSVSLLEPEGDFPALPPTEAEGELGAAEGGTASGGKLNHGRRLF